MEPELSRSFRRARLALAVPAPAPAGAASSKPLISCAEGSPENFYPGINPTGTSSDANGPIYKRIVEFERGGTKIVPGLTVRWDISQEGMVSTFHLRRGVK